MSVKERAETRNYYDSSTFACPNCGRGLTYNHEDEVVCCEDTEDIPTEPATGCGRVYDIDGPFVEIEEVSEQ